MVDTMDLDVSIIFQNEWLIVWNHTLSKITILAIQISCAYKLKNNTKFLAVVCNKFKMDDLILHIPKQPIHWNIFIDSAEVLNWFHWQ